MTNASPNFSYGVLEPKASEISGSIPNGIQVAYIKNLGSFGQDTGVSVAPGVVYKLTFDVAPRQDQTGTEGWSAQLFAGSNVLGSMTGTVTEGSNTPFTLVTITATAPLNATGDLIVQFTGTGASSGNQLVLFDNVSLTAAPEPSSLVMVGSCAMLGVAGLWRFRRRAGQAR